MHVLSKVVSGAAVAAAISVSTLPAGAVDTYCQSGLNATSISTFPSTLTTSSATYVQVVGFSMNAQTGTPCVHVQFTAQLRAKTPKVVRVRLTIDGNPAGFPNFVTLSTPGNTYDERAVTFFVPTLPAGFYQLAVEVLSEGGMPVNVRNALMRVQYDD